MFIIDPSEFFQTQMGCGCTITFRQRPVLDDSHVQVVDELVCPHGGAITLKPRLVGNFTLDIVYMEVAVTVR